MEKNEPTDALGYVERVNGNIQKMGSLGKTSLIVAAVVVVSSIFMALRFVSEQSKYVYVIRQNTELEADRTDQFSQREKEVRYHVQRFHEKFYNLAPNLEIIEFGINEALGMADESVLLKDNRRREQQFYTRLVQNLAVEEIRMDSLKVNVDSYPYLAHYYGRLYIIRNTTLSEYAFESTCRLINVPVSSSNLSGLRIENFLETRRELSRTGNRR